MNHKFAFGQKVIADGDDGNPMIVIAVTYLPEGAIEFQCSYWHSGELKNAWIPVWRLSAYDRP